MMGLSTRQSPERAKAFNDKQPRWHLAVAAALVFCLCYLTLQNAAIALAVAGAVLALVLPTPTLVISVLWVLLCRPGSEMFQTSIGSLTVTEIDILPLLATLAAFRVPSADGARPRVQSSSWMLILAWPTWYVIRAALPSAGIAAHSGSIPVDLRNVSMYLVLIPLAIYMQRRGGRAGLKLVAYGAYIACAIALAAWLLLALGLVSPSRTTFVNFLSLSDVRPGGELLIAVTAVLLLLGQAPLAFGSRALSGFLLIAEVLVSQTLSLAIAIAAGFMVASLLRWRTFKFGQKLLSIAAVLLFLTVAVGGTSADSRFNLTTRLGEDSAQYRIGELEVVYGELSTSILASTIGAGPGSIIAVGNPYTHQTDLKRDTHNVYANIALKTGLVGVALFLWPMLVFLRHLVVAKEARSRALAGSLVAVLVLSISVPFVWTAGGFSGLMILYLAALTSKIQTTEIAAEKPRRR
jgi:hypothetical protein